MTIIILGKNGFLGKSLSNLFQADFSYKHTVISVGREELNLLNADQVKSFFADKKDSIIINCAVKNGWRTQSPTSEDFYDNLLMHCNLTQYANYSKLFVFSSGADSDRDYPVNTKEGIINNFAHDYYGFSKHLTTQLSKLDSRTTVFRIFNCFGPLETGERFITSSINKCLQNQPIEIWEDKLFDFFYIEDLYRLLKHYILFGGPNEINCCYQDKLLLSQVANIISNYYDIKPNIIIQSKSNKSYIGDPNKINSLRIPFLGLSYGIEQLWKLKLNALMDK